MKDWLKGAVRSGGIQTRRVTRFCWLDDKMNPDALWQYSAAGWLKQWMFCPCGQPYQYEPLIINMAELTRGDGIEYTSFITPPPPTSYSLLLPFFKSNNPHKAALIERLRLRWFCCILQNNRVTVTWDVQDIRWPLPPSPWLWQDPSAEWAESQSWSTLRSEEAGQVLREGSDEERGKKREMLIYSNMCMLEKKK